MKDDEDVVNNVKVFIEYGKNKYDFSLDDKSSRAFNRNEPIQITFKKDMSTFLVYTFEEKE